ncbi:hypothetical protein CFC21_010165, partial [Triticum aestivum]
EGEMAAAP